MDLTKFNDKQLGEWIDSIKSSIKTMKQYKRASGDELNEAVLDSMFVGFEKGELRRSDLARIAKYLGAQISQEFLNDPHPDPYDLIHGGK